jgi:PadR family transcriptional regulator PadR
MLLLLLRERPTHGYELIEQLEALADGERVDVGNLYRALRALEEDGLVRSQWDAALPGPAKRTYEITADGARLLDEWAGALARARDRIDVFLDRYRNGGEHVPRR